MIKLNKKGVSTKTRLITVDEYNKILYTLCSSFEYEDKDKSGNLVIRKFRPATEVAFALELEANLGLRITDILQLTLDSFILDEQQEKYKLYFKEQRTNKVKDVCISSNIYKEIEAYALSLNKNSNDKLFCKSVRTIQSSLAIVCKKLGLKNVSTHSFRKFYAMRLYEDNDYNYEIVKELLNHSNVTTTQRYLGLSKKDIEQASKNHNYMLSDITTIEGSA